MVSKAERTARKIADQARKKDGKPPTTDREWTSAREVSKKVIREVVEDSRDR